MKKFLVCALTILLLATQVPTVWAAGSASVKGPGTVRAGDTITVSFSAGGGIYAGSGVVSFDSSQLTLKKYTRSISGSWKVEFNGNKFVFYDNEMTSPINGSKTIFKASFTVNKNLEPGTNISVSVGSIKLSDGSKDTNLGTKTYSATIAPPLSGNCKLASLTVSNANISPAFSTGTTSYTASVPFATGTLKVSAKAEDPDAKVTVKNTKLTAGATTTVSITVKAPNGNTKTYTIKVKRAQDPNYVPSTNAKLKALRVEDFLLSPAFSQDVQQYYVWLPYEVDKLSLEADTEDKKAEVKIGETDNLKAGKGTDIPVTVTAEDEKTTITYTVTAVRAPADAEAFLNPQATEPTLEPTEESTAPTEPVYTTPIDTRTDTMMVVYLIGGGILCLGLGLGLGIGIKVLADKKKIKKESEES